MDNKIIVLVGPTAVGKTYISVKLGQRLNTEIISADSMQIYKEMNIGTAKATIEEMQGVKHHMIDIIYPNENYSVSEFKNQSERIIEKLLLNNNLPIIVGGSGLYVNSLIYDLDFANVKSDEKIRDYYYTIYNKYGEDALYNILLDKDKDATEKIHKNNIKRVIRALEVCDITGKKFSEQSTDIRKYSDKYNYIMIGLNINRPLLYDRINHRVDKMLENGLVDEVETLLHKGYSKDLVSMQGIGYKEIIEYLFGEKNLDEAIDILKRNTRKFAKRQYTWFLRDKNITWFDVSTENIDETVESIYNYVIVK